MRYSLIIISPQLLNFFLSSVSMEEINDIEDVIDCWSSSDEDKEQLKGVSVSGIKDLEIMHTLQQECNTFIK